MKKDIFVVETLHFAHSYPDQETALAQARVFAQRRDLIGFNVLVYTNDKVSHVVTAYHSSIKDTTAGRVEVKRVVFDGALDFPGLQYRCAFTGILIDLHDTRNMQWLANTPYQVVVGGLNTWLANEREAREFYANLVEHRHA